MSGTRPIDFRSDTVTAPDAEMRTAMAKAEVGDDVLDRDPTLRRLEEHAAELLGMPEALWVPSGSMGNLVALFVHLDRGDRVFGPRRAHVFDSEVGTISWLAGGTAEPLDWDAAPGFPSPGAVREAASSSGPYFALRNRLLCLENTHNAAGGTVLSVEQMAALTAAARDRSLLVHLDGARIWHAAVALGADLHDLTRGADTVQACLSKGLGAPMGSIVGGTAEFVTEARRVRKMLGGGIRQGGIIGAAGIVALQRINRLAEDHEKAQRLAHGLRERGWSVDEPATNIVMASVDSPDEMVCTLEAVGVRTVAVGGRIRWITHHDVTDHDISAALDRVGPLVSA